MFKEIASRYREWLNNPFPKGVKHTISCSNGQVSEEVVSGKQLQINYLGSWELL